MPLLFDKLLAQLAYPLGLALGLWALALLALLIGRQRFAFLTLLAGGSWLGFWSLPVVADAVTARLTAAYAPAPIDALPGADAIVVLGGGIRPASRGRTDPDLNEAADRIWHAMRLYRDGKAPWVVVTGGSVWSGGTGTEAAAMRDFLVDLGVPEAFVVLEDRSRNTHENATMTAALGGDWAFERVLLVTSATHMRRAAATFRRAGFEVVPAPTDYVDFTDLPPLLRWLPDAEALDVSTRIIKEYLGLWVYRARGWADDG
jgi:uncharacterized SAM-binding protein YcdF (DUF218 family)